MNGLFFRSRPASQEELVAHTDGDNMVTFDTVDTDPDYLPATTQTLTSYSFEEVVLTLSHKKLLEGTAELATRCKINQRIATAMIANMVMCRGDSTDEC